jgi:hypothetical protein
MKETLLTLKGVGLPPLSARQCTQILEAIPLGKLYRTVNGKLIYTGDERNQKYTTLIKGQDKHPAGFDTLRHGQLVQVGCIQRLWQEEDTSLTQLGRPAVEGSVFVMNEQRKPLSFVQEGPRMIRILSEEKAYISYRPILDMCVREMNLSTAEWEGGSEWYLKLEEV